jgi:hypothetical protein
LLSVAMISGGVPFGAPTPIQALASYPFTVRRWSAGRAARRDAWPWSRRGAGACPT